MTAVWPAPDPTSLARPTTRRRVDGVDVARALAIAGMLVAHFAHRHEPSVLDSIRAFVDGRAMPLFVLLAGVSVTLMTRRAAHPDRALLVRAAVFLPLGLALQEWTVGLAIILPSYALYMVAAIGLRRLGDRALLAAAVGFVAAGAVTVQLLGPRWPGYASWDGGDGVLPPWGLLASLTVNGYYPLLPSGAFLCVGLWLGRRDLADARLAVRLVVVGLVLALAGYVGGRAIGDAVGADGTATTATGRVTLRADRVDQVVQGLQARNLDEVLDRLAGGTDEQRAQLRGLVAYAQDRVPEFHASRLFDASGHSEMPAWVVGATGTSLVAIGGCVLVTRRVALRPLAHLGQVSLTAYVAQALVINWTPSPVESTAGEEFVVTLAVLAGLVVFATLWRRRFRRGPLEAALHALARA